MEKRKYVKRLVSVGVSDAEALRIVNDFLKNFSLEDLEEYIKELENVD